MTPPPITNIETFRAALAAYRLPLVNVTAIELNLYTVIGTENVVHSEACSALEASERGLDVLYRNLSM